MVYVENLPLSGTAINYSSAHPTQHGEFDVKHLKIT